MPDKPLQKVKSVTFFYFFFIFSIFLLVIPRKNYIFATEIKRIKHNKR